MKTILSSFVLILLISSFMPVVIADAGDMDIVYLHISEFDTTYIVNITDKKIISLSVVRSSESYTPMEKPSMRLFTTDENQGSMQSEPIRYAQYTTEILKKGLNKYLYIYIPSNYYDDGYEKEIFSLDFEIAVEDEPFRMVLAPQDITYEYVVITSNLFWDTFTDNFTAWKIAHDDKISNILITNVSDIVNMSECWVNGTYGDATNTTGGNHWIPNGKEITSNYNLFNDSQCKIRNYIRYCYDTYGTRYVLLAGNRDNVPVRQVCTYAHSGPGGGWYTDSSHSSDMYYSCLDYCMNNDTDGLWMENNFSASIYWANVTETWDEIDWGFDVTVGRLLISSTTEADRWITKLKEYVDGNKYAKGNYLENNIVASKDATNAISNSTWTGYYPGYGYGPGIGDEFPENLSFINGQNITQAQWNNLDEYCNGVMPNVSGINIVYHSGHGGTQTPYAAVNLNNSVKANIFYTEGCNLAEYGASDPITAIETLIEDDGGPVAAIGNSAYGWFIGSTFYSEQFFKDMFNSTNGVLETCIAKANDMSREEIGSNWHSVAPMIVKELNFFGDPSLEYMFYDPEINQLPTITNPHPANGSTRQNLSLSWTVSIADFNGDAMNWSIDCENNQSDSGTTYNGTIHLNLTSLQFNTEYTIWVNVSDQVGETSRWYTFSTTARMSPENNSYNSIYNLTLIYYATEDGDISFYWDNDTLIGTVHDLIAGEQARVTVPMELIHDQEYHWYVNANGTNSSLLNFNTSKAWDLNEDAATDYEDVSLLVAHYTERVASWYAPWDINDDTYTNYMDVSRLVAHYNETY